MGHERKSEGKDEARVFDLSDWKDGVSINRDEEGWVAVESSPGIWMKDRLFGLKTALEG